MGLIKTLTNLFLPRSKSVHTSAFVSQPIHDDHPVHEAIAWPKQNHAFYSQLEDKYYQYFIGVNSLLDLALNNFEVNVINSLETTIDETPSLADDIPRLPDVIPKLIHLLRNEDFSWQEVADLISTDPVILLNIIKIASSPLYKLNIKEHELESILVNIGYSEVRKIIMRLSLKPIMLFDGGHFLKHSATKIWVHAVKTAIACRTLAVHYNQDPFDAYLAGLMHNLGMAIVVKHMNEIKDFTHAPRSLEFRNKLMTLSRDLSVLIARQWEIEPAVIHAIAEQTADSPEQIKTPIGNLLYQACAVSMKHILVNENRWNSNDNLHNPGVQFTRLYAKLEAMNI
jgi:HD-like signal output (HDOD) protein